MLKFVDLSRRERIAQSTLPADAHPHIEFRAEVAGEQTLNCKREDSARIRFRTRDAAYLVQRLA